jgi:pimeloyl-ACP methyl ester carboxylesterase
MDEQTFRSPECPINVAMSPVLGPPLVLLHGVTRRWQDFVPLLPAFATRWRVYALDHRGHGRSGRVGGGYAIRDYVRDVTAFLRHGLPEPAVIYGHSLGGMVAAAAAAEASDCVAALVLEDPPFDMMGERIGEVVRLDLFEAYAAVAGSGQTIDEIAAILAESLVVPPGGSAAVRLADLRDATALRFQAKCLKRLDPDVVTPILEKRWFDGFSAREILPRVNCPTLLLQADAGVGGMLPDDYASTLAALLPRGVRVKIPGVGHNIHWYNAPEATRLTLGFLESLDD